MGPKLKMVKDNFNGIDLQRLVLLKDIMQNLYMANSNGALQQLIQRIIELLTKLNSTQFNNVTNNASTQMVQMGQQANQPLSTIVPTQPGKQPPLPHANETQHQLLVELVAAIEKIRDSFPNIIWKSKLHFDAGVAMPVQILR
jgi:hypothetical protein